jgi:carbonic anhydrase
VNNYRTQALSNLAPSLGLTFQPDDWILGGITSQISVPFFERTKFYGSIHNLMSGKRDDLEVNFFDYQFGNRNTYKQTLATFSGDLWLPQFELSPQNALHKLVDAIVRKDIHFDTNTDFSNRFNLRGLDEQEIRKVFSPGMLAFLENFEPDLNWHLEGNGLYLIFYRLEELVNLEQFPDFVAQTTVMAQTFFNLAKKPA